MIHNKDKYIITVSVYLIIYRNFILCMYNSTISTKNGLYRFTLLYVVYDMYTRYMFYGFARYYLRHGVPWRHQEGYRRLTVTFRSVPRPGKRKRDEKQRRLSDVPLGARFRGV